MGIRREGHHVHEDTPAGTLTHTAATEADAITLEAILLGTAPQSPTVAPPVAEPPAPVFDPPAADEVVLESTVAPPAASPLTVLATYNAATKRVALQLVSAVDMTVWRGGATKTPGTFTLAAGVKSNRSFVVVPGLVFELRDGSAGGALLFSIPVPL